MSGERQDVHLFDPSTPPSANLALCGEVGKTMSAHEVKRGRITCRRCLELYSLEKKGE